MKTEPIPHERVERAKKLLLYVYGHRVQTYYGNIENFLKEMSTLKRWRKYSTETKNQYKNSWGKIAAARERFNACLSMPRGLINSIIGFTRDEDGKVIRYSTSQLVAQLGGFLEKVLHHGHRFTKNGANNYDVRGSWTSKYFLNKGLLFKLWHDDDMKKYFALDTLDDLRLQKLIVKYYKNVNKNINNKNEEKTTKKSTKEKKAMTILNNPKFPYPTEEKPTATQVQAVNVPDEDIFDDVQNAIATSTATSTATAYTRKNLHSKLLPRLQEFVDRRVISSGEARNFAKVYGVDIIIKTPRNEFIEQDIGEMSKAQLIVRGVVLRTFLDETRQFDLNDSQLKTVQATKAKLGYVKEKLAA